MAKEPTPRNLLKAATGGDVGEVMKLLDMSSTDQSDFRENRDDRLNVRDRTGGTALYLAVINNNSVAIQALASAGADINLLDKWNYTPLQLAVLNRRQSCVDALIKLGADINCVNSQRRNALMLAANDGQEGCLQLLIEAGAELNMQVKHNGLDYFGSTALMLAAENRHVGCLKLLLKAGADVNVKTSDGKTALHYTDVFTKPATQTLFDSVTFECIRALIAYGSDLTMTDSKGQTMLMYAARYNSQAYFLKILVHSEAVLDQQDAKGMTALAHAARTGSHLCVRCLLDHGASVNIRDYSGKSLLHFLVLEGIPEPQVIECLILLRKKLYVNATDDDGMTPLMHLVMKPSRKTATMAMLLKHGAGLNLVDNQGQTALIHSLKLGLDFSDLEQPFFLAYKGRPTDCYRFLITKGANPSLGQIASGRLSRVAFFENDLDLIKIQVGSAVDLGAPWEQFVKVFDDSKRRILQFMIIHGVMPALPPLNPKGGLLKYATDSNNPDLGVVKYLIATCYLRVEDLTFFRSEHSADHSVLNVINNLRSQPWPLVKLCFVAVSTAFGASPGRQERVKNSQLPVKLQNMLLFQRPWSRLCVHQWDKIPLTFGPENYEKLPRPRPLFYHWPVGRALVPCDCGECDGTMYKYDIDEKIDDSLLCPFTVPLWFKKWFRTATT